VGYAVPSEADGVRRYGRQIATIETLRPYVDEFRPRVSQLRRERSSDRSQRAVPVPRLRASRHDDAGEIDHLTSVERG
jgi:hypothetical protein